MPGSRSRRSKRSGGGWLGGLSPAPVGGRRSRRSRRSRRGGMPSFSPAPVSSLSPDADTQMKSFGIAGQGFGQGGPQITATTAGGYRRSRRGGGESFSPAPVSASSVGFNGVTMPVGPGSAVLSGGRRSRRSRR